MSDDGWPASVRLLQDLVSIESGPGMLDGIRAVQDQVADRLEALGFEIEYGETSGPGALIARREGTGAAVRVLMLGHADTVFAAGAVRDRPFEIVGRRATGPGVADMKGGLVVVLSALERLGESIAPISATVVVNGDEESGSAHSRAIIEDQARLHDMALVFEPARPSGHFVTSRRGVQRFRVEVRGKAAHTGVEPEKGANAIEAAALHAVRLQEIGRGIDGASVTVALVGGGSRPNIVPDEAWLLADSRFDDPSAESQVLEAFDRLASAPPVVPGTNTTVFRLDGRPAMVASPDTDRLAEMYRVVASELEQETAPTWTGGSSDGALTATLGVPTLDGLGPEGGGYHTSEEFVLLDAIEKRAQIAARFLSRVSADRDS